MGDVLRLFSIVQEDGTGLHTWAVVIAGVFVLIALALSSFLLFEHLIFYTKPEEQKWLVGVIFMVPVYAVESFISLWDLKLAVACSILRDCYEAFALYAFFSYLISCLGGDDKVVEFLESQANDGPQNPLLVHSRSKVVVRHPVPLNLCLPPWALQQSFYNIIKFGIVQYMILKTVCALLALILELFDAYGDGEFKWYYGYPYITVVLNFSQTWALYCLVQFYVVTVDELHAINPLAKFVCFKSIVFATWWQGVLIAVIFGSGVFGTSVTDGEKLQTVVQNFIICIEMAIAAVAHVYIFPATPYQISNEHRHGGASFSADYMLWDSELGSEEVKKSECVSKTHFRHLDIGDVATSLKASVQDVVLVGGEQVVHDVKATLSQAVKPVEKGISHLHEKLHERRKKHKEKKKQKKKLKIKYIKDDTFLLSSAESKRPLGREIDDSLLILGSMSDSALQRRRKPRNFHGSDADSSDSSDQGLFTSRTRSLKLIFKK